MPLSRFFFLETKKVVQASASTLSLFGFTCVQLCNFYLFISNLKNFLKCASERWTFFHWSELVMDAEEEVKRCKHFLCRAHSPVHMRTSALLKPIKQGSVLNFPCNNNDADREYMYFLYRHTKLTCIKDNIQNKKKQVYCSMEVVGVQKYVSDRLGTLVAAYLFPD